MAHCVLFVTHYLNIVYQSQNNRDLVKRMGISGLFSTFSSVLCLSINIIFHPHRHVAIEDLGLRSVARSELGSIIRGALMILRGRCKPESDAAMNDSWRVMPFRDQAFASSLFGNSATE